MGSPLPTFAGPEALIRHRRWFVPQQASDERILALLEPGEQVYATFDGVTAFPRCHRSGIAALYSLAICNVASAIAGVPLTPLIWGWLAMALVPTSLVLAAYLGGRSRRMLAATSCGLVVFRLDPLGRPREVLGRQQAAPPALLRQTRAYDYVAFGPNRIWVARDVDAVMRYMTAVLP